MSHEAIIPKGSAPHLAPYSPGVKVGNTVYVSGACSLDEAGATLRVFVLRGGALRLAKRLFVMPVALRRGGAATVLVVQSDIKPHRRVECPVLAQAEPRQLVVKHLALLLAKVAVLDAPVGDGAGHSMDQLPHGGLTLRCALFAKEIFRDYHLGRELRPTLGHLDILLLENDFACLVGDLRSALVPLQFVVRTALGIAEHPLDPDAGSFFALGQATPFWRGGTS